MFERFTERARQVIVLSQEESRTLKHNYIGTEHMLLGLLREEEGLAAQALESFDVTVEDVRAQVVRIVGSGEEVTSGQIPFTPRAKKVLELALRESQSLGQNYIGTEHILLGVLSENEGVAARVLRDSGVGADSLRKTVVEALGDPMLLESRSREKLVARAALIDVHLRAARRLEEIAAIVAGAQNEEAAIHELRGSLDITEAQAQWILNSDLRRFTRSQTQASAAMRHDVQLAIEALDRPPDN